MTLFQRLVFILHVFFFTTLHAVEPSYSVVTKNSLAGVIDHNGKQVIPIKYTVIDIDRSGYFRAFSAGSCSFFDHEGKLLFKSSEYAGYGNCGSGLLPVQDKVTKLWGYADLKGKIVIAPAYSVAKTFVSGLAVVGFPVPSGSKDGRAAAAPRVIDLTGKIVLDFSTCFEVYQLDLYPFNDSLVSFVGHVNDASGYMQPADDEVQGFITMRGELLTNTVRKTVHWLSERYMQPSTRSWMPYVCPVAEEQYVYCAPDGRVIIPGPFYSAHPFTEDGIAMVGAGGRDYFIDLSGNPLYDISRYTLAERMPGGGNLHPSYGNKRIVAYDEKEKRSVYLDTKGRVAITLDSGFFGMDFAEGIAPIWRWENKQRDRYVWTWIDTTGKILAPFDTVQGSYESPPRSRDELICFFDPAGKLMGARNVDGKVVIKPEWGYIQQERNNVYLVRQGPSNTRGPELGYTRSCGAFNSEGTLITKDFDSFSEFTSFTMRMESPSKITHVDFTGKEIGELIIDAMGIRSEVEQMREYRKKEKEPGD